MKVLTFQVKLFAPWMCLKPLVKVIMAHESFIVFCVRDNFYCSPIPVIFRGLTNLLWCFSICILRCNIERQSRNSIAEVWALCKKGCPKEFRTSHCLWFTNTHFNLRMLFHSWPLNVPSQLKSLFCETIEVALSAWLNVHSFGYKFHSVFIVGHFDM